MALSSFELQAFELVEKLNSDFESTIGVSLLTVMMNGAAVEIDCNGVGIWSCNNDDSTELSEELLRTRIANVAGELFDALKPVDDEGNIIPQPSPGQVNYEGYFKSCDGKSLISGAALPTWENQSLDIQKAWAAGAAATTAALYSRDPYRLYNETNKRLSQVMELLYACQREFEKVEACTSPEAAGDVVRGLMDSVPRLLAAIDSAVKVPAE